MPTKLYLDSGDEFTVAEPYAVVLDSWDSSPVEFTAIWWTHVQDEDAPLPEWPIYREQLLTIRMARVVAVARLEEAESQAIERARAISHSQAES